MSNLKTLLNIDLPIVQAPMAGVQTSALAVAVSEAGGLGSLPCAMLSQERIVEEVSAIKAQTSKPFNLNFFCHTSPPEDENAEAAWRALLSPFYREFDIDPQAIKAGPGRAPFSEEMADIVEEFRPAVVSFHFGLPNAELLERVKRSGAKVLSSATTVAEAQWLEQHGADAIIAQGIEAGGHRGCFLSEDLSLQMGTFALVPQIVAAVDCPVIAAGGIASGAGVKAIMQLGAAGVQIGTAYLLCDEAETSSVHRAALKSSESRHTAVTNLFTGRPARGIVNRVMSELGPIRPEAPAFPLAAGAIAPLRSRAEAQGRGEFSPLWAGQNTSGGKEISAGELTRQLAADLSDR